MNWLQALILGLIQGITEFLPVSSSGHLILGETILRIQTQESLTFTVVVHGATVLSTIVIFREDILNLLKGLFQFSWNQETRYITKLVLSMIPVVIAGLLFEKQIEEIFSGNVLFVGFMLLFTAFLLAFTHWSKPREKVVSFWDALIIGIAQAVAVLPGVSRSGATIATGLIIGNQKENTARFSFLMVLLPILGANAKKILDGDVSTASVNFIPLIIGFLAAFISGLIACKWMIKLVKKSKLIYFAIYCFSVGVIAILYALLH